MLEIGIACWTVIVRHTLAGDPAAPDFPLLVVEHVAELVVWQSRAGRPGAAIAILRRALALLKRHDLPRPLGLMCQYASMLISVGRRPEAERRLRQVLAMAEAEDVAPLSMVEEWINLANVLSARGAAAEALDASRHAVHVLLRARGGPDDRSELLPDTLANHAQYLADCDRPRAAAAAIRHVLAVVGRKADRAPDLYRAELVNALINASAILSAIGAMDEARTCSSRAVTQAKKLTGAAVAAHGKDLVAGFINHAIDQEKLGDAGFSTELARDAVAHGCWAAGRTHRGFACRGAC